MGGLYLIKTVDTNGDAANVLPASSRALSQGQYTQKF